MHFDTATRQRWMRVLAHSQPAALSARMNALSLAPGYDLLRAPEIGLVQIQARMGGTGARFFAGDATLTRAAIRLHSGTLGYGYVLGRDKAHAERCAGVCLGAELPAKPTDGIRLELLVAFFKPTAVCSDDIGEVKAVNELREVL